MAMVQYRFDKAKKLSISILLFIYSICDHKFSSILLFVYHCDYLFSFMTMCLQKIENLWGL